MHINEITFIIGNGFDLSCGLKTSYSDIYAGYINGVEGVSKVVEAFQKELREHQEKGSDTTWSRWSDFEMGLADYAKELHSEKELLECLEDFTWYIQSHLKLQEDSFIQQLKMSEDWKKAVLSEVDDSLISFFEKLPENNSIHLFNSADNVGGLKYNFLTFNYTSILDRLIVEINRQDYDSKSGIKYKTPIHIHGTLSSGMTLGIDNLDQLTGVNYTLSQTGKCALVKPYFNSVFDSNRVMQGMNAIKNSNLICVYGLSLGESDLTWRNALMQWIQESTDHHLVFYSHKYSKKMELIAWQKIIEENYAKIETLVLLGFDSSNYETYMNQIHVPIGESIFKISQIKNTTKKGVDIAHPPLFLR